MDRDQLNDDVVLRAVIQQSFGKIVIVPLAVVIAGFLRLSGMPGLGSLFLFAIGAFLVFDLLQGLVATVVGGIATGLGGATWKILIANAIRLIASAGLTIWFIDMLFQIYPNFGEPFLHHYFM